MTRPAPPSLSSAGALAVGALTVGALGLLAPHVALAQAACEELRLDGAADAAGSPEVTFVEGWRPELRAMSACLEAAPADRCLEVQGQYDDHAFAPSIERALGSPEAAQRERGRARAQAVIAELIELGVPYARVRERPPARAPSYRGVRVSLVEGCLAPTRAEASETSTMTTTALPGWLESADRALEAIDEAEARRRPPPSAEESPASHRLPLWIEGALALGVQLAGDTDAFSLAPSLGLGYGDGGVTARLFARVGTADELEQRAFFEWGFSVGGYLTPWWSLEAIAVHRVGTFRIGDPWYEQTAFLGVASDQQIVDLGGVSLWVSEALYPLGLRARRGVVSNGAPLDTEDRVDYAVRGELLLVVRGHFDAE